MAAKRKSWLVIEFLIIFWLTCTVIAICLYIAKTPDSPLPITVIMFFFCLGLGPLAVHFILNGNLRAGRSDSKKEKLMDELEFAIYCICEKGAAKGEMFGVASNGKYFKITVEGVTESEYLETRTKVINKQDGFEVKE